MITTSKGVKVRSISLYTTLIFLFFGSASIAIAAPYAAIVIDANNNAVLHQQNSDMRLHPAGLTKLITLYAAFDAIRLNEFSLDDMVTISEKSAAEPAVKLGLRAGLEIKVRYLIRAVGVKGANDAATALAEKISGSEAAFVDKLNRTSKRLGLTRSSWSNAHGLTEQGHLSTVRDISTLMLSHKREFPDFFNLFGRLSTDTGMKTASNSSKRILTSIEGIEASRYGYTRAAGFCAAVYVTRGSRSIVVVVHGANSTKDLVDRLSALIDANI